MLAVWIARVSTDVWTTPGRRPELASWRPPFSASAAPAGDKPTSTQPVNSPSAFHALSPCRSSTSLVMDKSLVWARCRANGNPPRRVIVDQAEVHARAPTFPPADRHYQCPYFSA